MLHIENLRKSFYLYQFEKEVAGCQDVSLQVGEGESVGIVGRSGAGKSTIIKCVYRTYLPSNGNIYFQSKQFGLVNLYNVTDQQMIAIRKREIGYVSQFLHVLPRVTAFEMMTNAGVEMGFSHEEAKEEGAKMLRHFCLSENLWDTYPQTFSGGEKLRLNIASAMVKRPRLLLLDEPTASLDEASKGLVREMLLRLKKDGTSLLGIYHDLEFMDSVVDKVYVMNKGVLAEGRTI